MKFKMLVEFLNGLVNSEVFVSDIFAEVEKYKNRSKEKGTSRPIYLLDEEGLVEIGSKEVLTLCDAFLKKEINKWHLYYICDALLLSDHIHFDNEDIEDAVASMTDPEVNDEIDKSVVMNIKKHMLSV